MVQKLTVITVVEGGNLQNIYCPDPSISIDHIAIDYDLAETGLKDDLMELISSLTEALIVELQFQSIDTVHESLKNCLILLEKMLHDS